jgi:hypothetical protein
MEFDTSLEDEIFKRKETLNVKIETKNKEIKEKLKPLKDLVLKLFDFALQDFVAFEKEFSSPTMAGQWYFSFRSNRWYGDCTYIGRVKEVVEKHFLRNVKKLIPDTKCFSLDNDFELKISEAFSYSEIEDLFEFLKECYYNLLEREQKKIDLAEGKLFVNLPVLAM